LFVGHGVGLQARHHVGKVVRDLALPVPELDFRHVYLRADVKLKVSPPRSIENPRASTMSSCPFGNWSSSCSNSLSFREMWCQTLWPSYLAATARARVTLSTSDF